MPRYCFALHCDDGLLEQLGHMALRDDDEALDFGKQIARDLADEDVERQVVRKIVVTRNRHTVSALPISRADDHAD